MMMLALWEVFPRLSSCFGFGAVVGWMLGDGRGGLVDEFKDVVLFWWCRLDFLIDILSNRSEKERKLCTGGV